MQNETNQKVIFGLSPRATLLNSIIFSCLSQLFWAISIVQKLPVGTTIKTFPAQSYDVPWYIDFPLMVLSLVMAMAWSQHTFKIERGDLSWRAFRYKYVYVFIAGFLLQEISRLIFLLILL